MALFTPDYEYRNGKKALEELKGLDGDLIRYYVKQKDHHINKLNKKIQDMYEVFEGIKKYTR